MKIDFEDFSNPMYIRKYTKALTNSEYVFAVGSNRKWGDSNAIETENNGKPFYQLMPDSLDEGFFDWYVSARSKYQFFKTEEMCLLHFVFYYDVWVKNGKPSLSDVDKNEYQ